MFEKLKHLLHLDREESVRNPGEDGGSLVPVPSEDQEKPGETPEKPLEPVMAWAGSHLTLDQAVDTLSAVAKYASGKPATRETMAKIPLPDGITPDDAVDCVRHYIAARKDEKSYLAKLKRDAVAEKLAVLTVRARLKVAGKRLFPKSKPNRKRAKMAKQSRRQNR